MGIKIKDMANSAPSLWSMPTDLNLGQMNMLPLETLPSLLLASSEIPKFLVYSFIYRTSHINDEYSAGLSVDSCTASREAYSFPLQFLIRGKSSTLVMVIFH